MRQQQRALYLKDKEEVAAAAAACAKATSAADSQRTNKQTNKQTNNMGPRKEITGGHHTTHTHYTYYKRVTHSFVRR
jgi:hypothetical protein